MPVPYTVFPTKFPDYWDFVVARVWETCAEILLYGMLLILLIIAAYLLYKRRGTERPSLAVATMLMALLATLQLGVRIWGTVLAFKILRLAVQGEVYPHSPSAVRASKLYVTIYTAGDLLLVTNNLVADSLFTYRCFIVWNCDIRVVVVPILMTLTTTVLGYLAAYDDDYVRAGPYIDFRIAFIMSVLTNVLLMALTAGRIWWIQRAAWVLSESVCVRRYNTVIAIILESGAIYCVSVGAYMISVSVLNPQRFNPLITVFGGTVPQIMNIAPTLIVVRVGLGYANGGKDTSSVSTMQQRQTTRRISAGTVRCPANSVVIDIRAARDREAGTRTSAESREDI
ncbi:hypothetical protein B0H17DRAFT_1211140 [Mycena rosella]|uniref:Uncharacterized protein n=1 Tax=Mycena rosella TaxID=1033263 RepID=A0AAD7CW27_MYCRO|nr:hypothetical protein B0H17DRAFT_1211140 [Mycena rosella]